MPWGEASAYDVLWADLVLIESTAFDASTEETEAAATETLEPEPPVEAVDAEEESEAEAPAAGSEEDAVDEEGDE